MRNMGEYMGFGWEEGVGERVLVFGGMVLDRLGDWWVMILG